MDLRGLVASLRENAQTADERRLLALTGDREAGIDAAYTVIEAAGVDDEAVSLVTTRKGFRYHRLHPDHPDKLFDLFLGVGGQCAVGSDFLGHAVGHTHELIVAGHKVGFAFEFK